MFRNPWLTLSSRVRLFLAPAVAGVLGFYLAKFFIPEWSVAQALVVSAGSALGVWTYWYRAESAKARHSEGLASRH